MQTLSVTPDRDRSHGRVSKRVSFSLSKGRKSERDRPGSEIAQQIEDDDSKSVSGLEAVDTQHEEKLATSILSGKKSSIETER